jgi:glutathione peroxidase
MTTAISDIQLTTIKGAPATLADYDGQVLLIVNTASKCGLTPQYAALEALHRKYKEKGFAVLGFPANDFAAQEPGDEATIATFCETQFDVTFPMFDKHPLYAALTQARPEAEGTAGFREKLAGYGVTVNPEPEVLWNFEKFLVARDRMVVARFSPDMMPDADMIVTAIEGELFATE